MTKADKELLFKDLCGRLPYKVYAQVPDEYGGYTAAIESIDIDGFVKDFEGAQTEIENIKPYLLPMSSMTEEQKKKYCSLVWFDGLSAGWNRDDAVILDEVEMLIDFYHKNHLDWRGLIPKNLALDATKLKIY